MSNHIKSNYSQKKAGIRENLGIFAFTHKRLRANSLLVRDILSLPLTDSDEEFLSSGLSSFRTREKCSVIFSRF